MRYMSKRQEMEWMADRLEDARREWKVGDEVLARGGGTTTITRIEDAAPGIGKVAYLADGESLHVGKLQRKRS